MGACCWAERGAAAAPAQAMALVDVADSADVVDDLGSLLSLPLFGRWDLRGQSLQWFALQCDLVARVHPQKDPRTKPTAL